MIRKKVGIIFIMFTISLILIFFILWFMLRLAAPTKELNDQLQFMISQHDTNNVKSLSIDSETAKFLLSLSKDTPVSASDNQGAEEVTPGVVIGYFPARVGNESLQCYMVQLDNGKFSWMPKWKLLKVSLSPQIISQSWLRNEKVLNGYYVK